MFHISVSMLAQVFLPRIPFLCRYIINLSVQPIAILFTGKESHIGIPSILHRTWTDLPAQRMTHHECRADLHESSLGRWTPSLLATLPDLIDLLLLLVVPDVHHVVWVVFELSTDVLEVLGGQYLR